MTRKDFERIAAIINEAKTEQDQAIVEKSPISTLYDVADRFCESFKAENPRFDKDRFLKACGFNI